jgi:hypothetical protein
MYVAEEQGGPEDAAVAEPDPSKLKVNQSQAGGHHHCCQPTSVNSVDG